MFPYFSKCKGLNTEDPLVESLLHRRLKWGREDTAASLPWPRDSLLTQQAALPLPAHCWSCHWVHIHIFILQQNIYIFQGVTHSTGKALWRKVTFAANAWNSKDGVDLLRSRHQMGSVLLLVTVRGNTFIFHNLFSSQCRDWSTVYCSRSWQTRCKQPASSASRNWRMLSFWGCHTFLFRLFLFSWHSKSRVCPCEQDVHEMLHLAFPSVRTLASAWYKCTTRSSFPTQTLSYAVRPPLF